MQLEDRALKRERAAHEAALSSTAAVRLTRIAAPFGHHTEALIAKCGNDQDQTVVVAFRAKGLAPA